MLTQPPRDDSDLDLYVVLKDTAPYKEMDAESVA
jgi:hypothetical protein